MSQKPSKFWSFALPVSLLILFAAYYIKVPVVRTFIDAHTTLAHRFLGPFVQQPTVIEVPAPADPVTGYESPIRRQDLSTISKPMTVATAAKLAAPAPPAVSDTPGVFDLQRLARDRTLWPKKVCLKKAANFPAVVGGKVVGTLIAPVGAEANLVAIKDGKVGLEYEGGGAWLAVEDTDIATRVPGR